MKAFEILGNTWGKEWFELNAKLQQKKNTLRKELKEKGVLKKGATNQFDKYSYFSEAQYKELFTELFSSCNLELKFTELEYTTFEGSEKQANGRMPKLEFTLTDIETGFFETSIITGEGIDKGDKAGYKAYTGALKYYLANTFMVASGDDPEKESPATKMNSVNRSERKASAKQIEILSKTYTGENLTKLLKMNNISKLEEMTISKGSELIGKLKEAEKKEKEGMRELDEISGFLAAMLNDGEPR